MMGLAALHLTDQQQKVALALGVYASYRAVAWLREKARLSGLRRMYAAWAAREQRACAEKLAAAVAAGLDEQGMLAWRATQKQAAKWRAPDAVLEMGACELVDAMAAGELTSEYVTRCVVARAMRAGEQLSCNTEQDYVNAVAAAAERDAERARGGVRGPLHGLPVSFKEQYHQKGFHSTCGVVCRLARTCDDDANLVRLVRAAGGIPFVRTNVPQLCMLPESFNAIYGTTRNPYDEARTSGGSSGGEGALVAARGSPLGLGTDIGGSIRIPCVCSA
jgi:hypothetical protein